MSSIVSGLISEVIGEKPKGTATAIEFIEGEWGLGVKLFPVQKFILKLYYGLPLDREIKTIKIYSDLFKEHLAGTVTEWEYLEYLWNQKRINLNPKTDDLTKIRNELVLIIGRGGSKTSLSQFIGCYEFYKLLSHENPQRHYGLTDMSEIGMQNVAPSESQAMDLFSGLMNGFENSAWFAPFRNKKNAETHMRFRTASDIKKFGLMYKGTLKAKITRANAGSVRGGSNIVVIFDELAHFIGNDGRHSDSRIYTALTPSTSRFRNDGKKVSISTPLNKGGKLWDLYDRSIDPARNNNMLMLQIPTWEINELVDSEYLKGEYADSPRSYLCEFGAQFSDQVTAWVNHDMFMNCVKDFLSEAQTGTPGMEYFMGIDIGLKNDGTGICVVHPEEIPDEDGFLRTVFILDYATLFKPGEGKYAGKNPLSLEDMADEVLEIWNRFPIRKGVFDQWAGIPFEDALRRRGITRLELVSFTDTINSEIYRILEVLYLQDNVWLYEYRPLIEEILKLQAEQRTKYKTIVQAPQTTGAHDDISDAFARAIWSAFSARKAGMARIISTNPGAGLHETPDTSKGGNKNSGAGNYKMYQKRSIMRGAHTSPKTLRGNTFLMRR